MSFRRETERLVLRAWEPTDFEPFRRIASDPRVMRYIASGRPWTDSQIRAFLERQHRQLAELGYCLAALGLRETGEVVGQAGLQPLGDTGEVEIGWWLRPDCWGLGLATEAARAFLRLGFEEAGLERIVAIAHPDNHPSHAVMERLDMRFEGRRLGSELGLLDPDVEVLLYALEPAAGSRLGSRARR